MGLGVIMCRFGGMVVCWIVSIVLIRFVMFVVVLV